MEYNHIILEEHPEGTLIKRVSTGETIGGVTRKGVFLTQERLNLSDDELLELLTIPPKKES
jgi:hypothetical protein